MSEWINKLINGKDVEQMSRTLLIVGYNHIFYLGEMLTYIFGKMSTRIITISYLEQTKIETITVE